MNMAKESSSFLADIKKYEDILVNEPNSYCFTILSELYRKLGMLDEAINAANRGIEIHPDYIGGHMAAGRAYFDKGMKEESKIALERVARVTPDNLLAQKLLIQIYIDVGNLSEATKTLQVIELLNPGDVESRQLFETFDKNVSVDDHSSDSQSTVVHDTETAASESTNEFAAEDKSMETELPCELADAVSIKGVSVSSDGKDPLVTATMAELYVSQGYFNKAMNVYRDLLEKSPESEEYRTRLEELQRHCSMQDEETSIHETGGQEENIFDDRNMETYECTINTPDFVRTDGNDGMILSILESWLVNIDRGRYATKGNTQKYC
jgi:tetratricopeptide (TPR) repeat protein